MIGKFLTVLSIFFLAAGCATRPSRKGVISQELPLTLGDLAEIKAGEENHTKILEEYTIYHSPKLETYVNAIAASLAEVSTRPHLPYQVILLDDDEVKIFGGPGGYIYISRGLLNFVQSESELAAVIAHEIGHISAYEYAHIPQRSKIKFVYENLMRGSELAKDTIGTYGTAFNYGMKGVQKAAPIVARRFGNDEEVLADENAVKYLMKAEYDPRGLEQFLNRLSIVEMEDVGRFVEFMHIHPPFQARREVLKEDLAEINFESGKIEFKKDLLAEVRQTVINAPTSIVFQPEIGVHHAEPVPSTQPQEEDGKMTAIRKKWGWF